jgi:histidine ammonia-lyase
MERVHHISTKPLSLQYVRDLLAKNSRLALSDEAKERIQKCRDYLDRKMQQQTAPIYGITTGFGSLCNVSVDRSQLAQLQKNLVMSHACGLGEEVPHDIIRLMLFLKIQSLSYGYSGVQLATVERLVAFFNEGVYPVVYQQGSLGASGDLAPLAHLCLPLLGLGEVDYEGRRMPAQELNRLKGWQPIELQSKEGLALLNGTQFMGSFGLAILLKAHRLSALADLIAALSLDAYDGRVEPFTEGVHTVRPHTGQLQTAAVMRRLLEGSEIAAQPKAHVQDPYSFRCVPQVHGASKDCLAYVSQVFETEINSATDNPTVLPDEDKVVSAGNFHGQPLALALDFLAIGLAELGSISERRTYQLISGKRGLPSFLVARPGLNSGFMIPQYTQASIVSQNKQLCTPACIDTIDSSQGQEDHVSMGANAATKCYRVVQNLEKILAIELLNAAQALEFRRPLRSSAIVETFVASFRETVPFVEEDPLMYPLMQAAVKFLQETPVLNEACV